MTDKILPEIFSQIRQILEKNQKKDDFNVSQKEYEKCQDELFTGGHPPTKAMKELIDFLVPIVQGFDEPGLYK